MKKILMIITLSFMIILLSGCGKYNEKSITKDINKKYNSIKGYYLEGDMTVYNNENIYRYNVKSSYENDRYRVSLLNKSNDNEQIILRNDDGVYVLTPSLNKSFKFQSNWPNNTSQVYLPKSLSKDILKDKKIKMKENNKGYIIYTKPLYTNNKNLNNEEISFDKKLNIKEVKVFDKNGNIQIKMVYKEFDPKATFSKKYFSVSENMKSSINTSKNKETNNLNKKEESEFDKEEKEEEKTSLTEDTVYPMFLPKGTYLSNEESVSKEDKERVILTFDGDFPFILVEESVFKEDSLDEVLVYGEPTLLVDSVVALSDSSANFISNGVEYYLASENLSKQDIIDVIESISQVPIMK